MAALTINIGPITGDTATAVSVVTLQRSDNQQTPSGVTLPLALSLSNGLWSGSFTDAAPAPYYVYSFNITWADGSTTGPYPGRVSSETPASGYYTNQGNLETKWGAQNVLTWSNKDNTSAATNTLAVQYALNLADDQINRFFDHGPYSIPLSPIPTIVTDWATVLAGFELYTERGLWDEKDQVGGKLAKARGQVMRQMAQYKGGVYVLPCARRWPSPTGPVAVNT